MRLVCFLLILGFWCSGQKSKAQSSNEVAQITLDDPDQIHKFWLSGLTFSHRGRVNFIEGKYYHNNRLFLNAEYGMPYVVENGFSGGIYATYTLVARTVLSVKEKKIKLWKDGTSKYYLKTPIKEKKALGLRLGFDYTNYEKSETINFEKQTFPETFGALVFGLSYYKQSFTRIVSMGIDRPRFSQYTRFLSLTADAVYYPILPAESSRMLTKQVYNSVAFRTGFEGYFSFASPKAWGCILGAGGEVGPEKAGRIKINSYFKLMIYVAFGTRLQPK